MQQQSRSLVVLPAAVLYSLHFLAAWISSGTEMETAGRSFSQEGSDDKLLNEKICCSKLSTVWFKVSARCSSSSHASENPSFIARPNRFLCFFGKSTYFLYLNPILNSPLTSHPILFNSISLAFLVLSSSLPQWVDLIAPALNVSKWFQNNLQHVNL